MQLEVVNIEDVYPDENNPRQKFEDIKELAESFSRNEERPGEPDDPPIVVREVVSSVSLMANVAIEQ